MLNKDHLLLPIPGNTTYSDIINKGKKVKIFGTSMIKAIRNREFNFYLDRCHAELKSYPETTAKIFPVSIDTVSMIQMDTPDIVVIHGR